MNDPIESPLDLLREVEWGGTVWSDYPCCLFCGRLLAGLPRTVYDNGTVMPAEPPGEHRSDCRWVKATAA